MASVAAVSGPAYHLTVFNIGRTVAPLDAPQLKGFMDGLDPINALAEQSPGFVWRYTADGTNNATVARPMGHDIIINFGVWQSREHLWNFVYRTQHLDFLGRRREWFLHLPEPFLVLWWVPAGHIPSLAEAVAKLDYLRDSGPTAEAFTFREPFDRPTGRGSPAAGSEREPVAGSPTARDAAVE
jgi:hypothetical protein